MPSRGSFPPREAPCYKGLLKSWWVSSDLGRRGTGKGEPWCPQLAAAGSSVVPWGTAQGCRARGCSSAKGFATRDVPF